MSDEELHFLITGNAAAAGLPIDPAHRAGIAANVRRLLAEADIVMAVPLTPDMEPSPIFRP